MGNLAQIEISDWGELIVIGLVVVGSALANWATSVSKKKKDEEQLEGAPRPRSRDAGRVPKELRPQPSGNPVNERSGVPPIVPPRPGMELHRETQDELEMLRRRGAERQRSGQFVPPPPIAKPVPSEADHVRAQREARERARRREEQRRKEADRQRQKSSRQTPREPEPTAEKPRETLNERAARLERQRAARLGHVAEGLIEDVEIVEVVAASSAPRLTRDNLRDAIILKEILSPPLAIRAAEDPWSS